ncbi:MAG: ABC transporter ATP-binding protein [Catenulispora sp.]|nr:ABC transporter ATP-binding protein [Catenulispora sp.]
MGGPPMGMMMRGARGRDDKEILNHKLAPGTIKRILGIARPYRLFIALFLVVVIGDAVLVVLPPLLSQQLVDDGVLKGDKGLVTRLALIIAAVAIADAGASLVQRFLSSRIGEGLIYDLRTRVFAHVQRMPIAFFTRTQTGALISRLNSDVIGAQQAFTSVLSNVVSNVISLVLVAGTMFYLSWQITVLSLLLLPIFLIPARRVGKRMQGQVRRQMTLNADMSAMMTERFNVSGALLTKLFGRPEEEDAEFAQKAAGVRDAGVTIALTGAAFMTVLTLVASLATALTYLIGGRLAISHSITLGTLMALAALLGRLYGPLTALTNVRITVMSALVSFDRVFEVLDLEPMIKERPDAGRVPEGQVAVEFEDVAFRYPSADEVSLASLESVARLDQAPSAQVLRGVTFRAAPGEMVALVGPSGAGKTTITSLANRLYDPTAGSVRIGGVDIRDVTLESLHATVGTVTQDAHMFHTTIRGNLLYARPSATEPELLDALRDAQILDLVRSLPDGLDTVVGDRGYRLSGGEKQRLAIARLLLKAPSVVVLDEATAHLDSESEAAVQRALARALRGRTSLVIAHRLSTVRDADQILVVEDGRIVEQGRHEELLAAGGVYAELYRVQFQGQEGGVPAA